MSRRILAAAAFLVAAASGAAPLAGNGATPFVASDPPSAKDALRLAFRNAALALPRGGSCEGVDTTGIADPTIGDYLAGFLGELRPTAGVSGVAGTCRGALTDLACEITIRREAGDEVWAWGLRFRADGVSGDIVPESLECTGAG